MKFSKLTSLIMASLFVFTPISLEAATKSSKQTKTTVIKQNKKSTKTATKKQSIQKKQAPTTEKTTSSHKTFGVKGAQLKPSKVAEKRYTYREKGKVHSTISKEASRQYSQIGSASYYGGFFHGRKTASGEIFNKNAYTAAHKTLALGSYALVTNLSNGRKVIVKINDRGPFHGNRIIDLSEGAAREIQMIKAGVAKVKIEAIHVDSEGYISGKGAESLIKLARKEGLPLKIRGSGSNLAFKTDSKNKTTSKQAVEKKAESAKNGNKTTKVQVKSFALHKPKFALKVTVDNEKTAKKLTYQVKQKAYIVPNGKKYTVIFDTADNLAQQKLRTQLRKLGYTNISNYYSTK